MDARRKLLWEKIHEISRDARRAELKRINSPVPPKVLAKKEPRFDDKLMHEVLVSCGFD